MIEQKSKLIVVLILIIATIAIYWPVQNYEFVDYDDILYISGNYIVKAGFTYNNLINAFTDTSTSNWHPLTMLSHMLDWRIFGNNAGGHHWTNVIIHIINTLLLFIFFRNVTGAIWPSAFIAALFAIHPLNVESVAWVSERKNVLSTFFWILTMILYVRYVQLPGWKRYLPVFICFALGLMTKPMLVTLPFVLLLLDYWPLNRTTLYSQDKEKNQTPIVVNKLKISSLILEKVPLFSLVISSIVLTLIAQRSVGAIAGLDALPLSDRIINSIFSYVLYIKKIFSPDDLLFLYLRSYIPLWQIFLAAISIAVITFLVLKCFRSHPYLPVGWFWYLGTLIPVIGIVQVGTQSMADRYTYVPSIGIFICLAWGVPQLLNKISYRKPLIVFIAGFFILFFIQASYHQVKIWKNDFTLSSYFMKMNPEYYLGYQIMGASMEKSGKNEQALYFYYLAIKKKPNFAPAYINAGNILKKMGKTNAAIIWYSKALQLDDKSADAYYNLGTLYLEINQNEAAIVNLLKALEIKYYDPDYHINLGVALMRIGNAQKALKHFQEALRYNPQSAEAKRNYDMVRAMQERK
jgi:Tfp pilus assembly protein PilF